MQGTCFTAGFFLRCDSPELAVLRLSSAPNSEQFNGWFRALSRLSGGRGTTGC